MHISTNIAANTFVNNKKENSSPVFGARNHIIRDLGEVNMLTRREFQGFSNTYMDYKHTAGELSWKVNSYISDLIEELRGFSSLERHPGRQVARCLGSIKSMKVRNCMELAKAGFVACKLNGYEDTKCFEMFAYNSKTGNVRDLFHSVVGVNCKPSGTKAKNMSKVPIYMNDREGVIVDPWLGFVDFQNNANLVYLNSGLGGKLRPDEQICFIEQDFASGVSDKDLSFFKFKYPKLVKETHKDDFKGVELSEKDIKIYQVPCMSRSVMEAHKRHHGFKNALSASELAELCNSEEHEDEIITKLTEYYAKWAEGKEQVRKKGKVNANPSAKRPNKIVEWLNRFFSIFLV